MELDSAGPFIYQIGEEYYISPVPHDFVFQHGLPPEAIMGSLVEGQEHYDPEHFLANSRFRSFLHEILGRYAPKNPDLVAIARKQWHGSIAIVDGRTPTPDGEVPPVDIIGAVELHNGSIKAYHANPNHRLFTSSGIMQLNPWFRGKLLEEIEKLMGDR